MGWVTRRERGITRLSERWGCAALGRWWGPTLSRTPSSVSFSVDAAESGSSVSLFFLVDDHLAANRSESLLLRPALRDPVTVPSSTRVERSSESWRLVESVIHGLDSALRSGQQLQSTTVVERLKFFIVDRTDLPL